MSARKITIEILDHCENGLLSWESVARECLSYMSEYDVKDMNNTAEFVSDNDDEEE